ncbi:hypothetical protein DENSPDRAFT_838748 [Dentipellis sp. KUC8613]|nr:hypothetical protein DENSPDRAFT_838748 [Dentipellis sp. KUC8613]
MPEGNPSKPARVPYVFPPPGTNEVADGIRARRTGQNPGLIDLDGVLLNAEAVAQGWNALGGALRNKSSLPLDILETLILRVSVLNGSAYVWREHEIIGRDVGLTPKALFTIRTTPAFAFAPSTGTGPSAITSQPSIEDGLTSVHLAALDYADHMTRTIKVPQPVFDRLKTKLKDDRQIVEATATVAGYNLTTRVLRALDVAGLAEEEVPIPVVD